jgi:hypothetical protein
MGLKNNFFQGDICFVTQFKSVLETSFDDKNCNNELLSLIILKCDAQGR